MLPVIWGWDQGLPNAADWHDGQTEVLSNASQSPIRRMLRKTAKAAE
jgi:hypothetical protein